MTDPHSGTPPMNATEVEQRLNTITSYVVDCQRRVNKGEIIDLQGLDDNVVEICDALAGLPQKDARALESRMSTLIDHLELLAGTMKVQQDKIATR